MGTINPATVSDGETIDASDLNNPINTIANEINGNLDADNIANGSITNAKLSTTAGQPNGAWATWTPTLTNVDNDGANSTIVAHYTQIGKTVHYRFKITFAGGDKPNGAVIFSLPVTASSNYAVGDASIGNVRFTDASPAANYAGVPVFTSTASMSTRRLAIPTTNLEYAQINATNPFTWANSDIIEVTGTYEAA